MALCALLAYRAPAVGQDAATDRAALQAGYAQRFAGVGPADLVDGVYAIDPELREQWLEIQAFPPYEFALDEGREAYEAPLADGARYADCLGPDPAVIGRTYPRFDEATASVITLPLALNACREAHGEPPLAYASDALAALLAWLAHAARGGTLAVPDPASAAARETYEQGRALFFTKRGQLNFSCADCHVTAAGARLRQQRLTPLLGVVNRYPAYWLRWGSMGTLHQRFAGCMEMVGAEPYVPQEPPLRALEYFLATMGSGLPMRGPSTQR